MKPRRNRLENKKAYREGFEFEGRWITPDEAHRVCKDKMDRFDALPKEKRQIIHRLGYLPDEDP